MYTPLSGSKAASPREGNKAWSTCPALNKNPTELTPFCDASGNFTMSKLSAKNSEKSLNEKTCSLKNRDPSSLPPRRRDSDSVFAARRISRQKLLPSLDRASSPRLATQSTLLRPSSSLLDVPSCETANRGYFLFPDFHPNTEAALLGDRPTVKRGSTDIISCSTPDTTFSSAAPPTDLHACEERTEEISFKSLSPTQMLLCKTSTPTSTKHKSNTMRSASTRRPHHLQPSFEEHKNYLRVQNSSASYQSKQKDPQQKRRLVKPEQYHLSSGFLFEDFPLPPTSPHVEAVHSYESVQPPPSPLGILHPSRPATGNRKEHSSKFLRESSEKIDRTRRETLPSAHARLTLPFEHTSPPSAHSMFSASSTSDSRVPSHPNTLISSPFVTHCRLRSGSDRRSRDWSDIYGGRKSEEDDEKSVKLDKRISRAGDSKVKNSYYESFLHSIEHTTRTGTDRKGNNAGIGNKPGQHRSGTSFVPPNMLHDIPVVSSTSSGDDESEYYSVSDRASEERVRAATQHRSHVTAQTRHPSQMAQTRHPSQMAQSLGRCPLLLSDSIELLSQENSSESRTPSIVCQGPQQADGGDGDDSGLRSPSTALRSLLKLKKSDMGNATRQKKETGLNRPSMSSDEGSTAEDGCNAEDVGWPQLCIPTNASNDEEGREMTPSKTAMLKNNTSTDDDTEEDDNGDGASTRPPRITALERILSTVAQLAELTEFDQETETNMDIHTPLRPPATPSTSDGAASSNNVQRNCGPASARFLRAPLTMGLGRGGGRGLMMPSTCFRGYLACHSQRTPAYPQIDPLDRPPYAPLLPCTGNGCRLRPWEGAALSTSMSTTTYPGGFSYHPAVGYESPTPRLRRTPESLKVHEILGYDPQTEISSVQSPLWQSLHP